MSAERAVAFQRLSDRCVVNPSVRLPAERSTARRESRAWVTATCLFPVFFAAWAHVGVQYLNGVLA